MKKAWSLLVLTTTSFSYGMMREKPLISIQAFPSSGIGTWWREDGTKGLYRILRYEKKRNIVEVKIKEKTSYGLIEGQLSGTPITFCSPEASAEFSKELFSSSYPEDNPDTHILFTQEERKLVEQYRGKSIDWKEEPVDNCPD